MAFQAGTYARNSEYGNSSGREDRLARVVSSMRAETDESFRQAEHERHLARLGVLQLRRERGFDTRPY